MKKSLYTLVTLTVFNFSINAQESNYPDLKPVKQTIIKLGLKGGINFSTFTESESKLKTGFHIGGLMEIFVNDKFSIQPELMYSTQGAKASMSDYDDWGTERVDYVYKAEMKTNYINVPIMVKYYFREGFNVQIGPQIGFLVNSKLNFFEGIYSSTGEKKTTDITADLKKFVNPIDFGLNIGLGYELPRGLFFDARYNIGLTRMNKKGGYYYDEMNDFELEDAGGSSMNRVFQVSVGYKF